MTNGGDIVVASPSLNNSQQHYRLEFKNNLLPSHERIAYCVTYPNRHIIIPSSHNRCATNGLMMPGRCQSQKPHCTSPLDFNQ